MPLMTSLLLLVGTAAPLPAGETPPVADAELASMRGGFSLPGGLDIALAVRTETLVDGNLLLRTVFSAENGKPVLQTSAPSAASPAAGVSVQSTAEGQRVRVQGDAIDVTHLVGNAIGSIVANSANGRMIDTRTDIDIDIRGATPMNIGSAMFRVEALGIEAVRGLTR